MQKKLADKGVGKSFIKKISGYLLSCKVVILGFKPDGADTRMVFQKKGIFDFLRTTNGKTNIDRMVGRRVPIGIDDLAVELHHLLQEEPGPMVTLLSTFQDEFYDELHGFVGRGESFRRIPQLNNQYNNFRNNYWKKIGTRLKAGQ